MKSLQHHLNEYVDARRSLGTRLEESAKALCLFVRFLRRRKARFITIQLALEWSQQSRPNVQRATWARKLSMVRQFARWMSVIESPTQSNGALTFKTGIRKVSPTRHRMPTVTARRGSRGLILNASCASRSALDFGNENTVSVIRAV